MTHIKVLSFTSKGAEQGAYIAERLSDALIERYQLREDLSLSASSVNRLVQQAMVDCDLIVLISEIDFAVRVIAPYIANTGYDPGVLCLNASTDHAVQILNNKKDKVNAAMEQIADLFHVPLVK